MTATATRQPTLDSPRPDRLSRQGWAVLLVLCGTVFLEGLDVSMMGVALPSIRADLGLSTSALQWVVSAYVLGYGGFVLLGGRAADLLGRRRMFLAALTVFIAFSGLGGLAPTGWVLILARFATGRQRRLPHPGEPVDHHHHLRRGRRAATGPCSSTAARRPAASRSAWSPADC